MVLEIEGLNCTATHIAIRSAGTQSNQQGIKGTGDDDDQPVCTVPFMRFIVRSQRPVDGIPEWVGYGWLLARVVRSRCLRDRASGGSWRLVRLDDDAAASLRFCTAVLLQFLMRCACGPPMPRPHGRLARLPALVPFVRTASTIGTTSMLWCNEVRGN